MCNGANFTGPKLHVRTKEYADEALTVSVRTPTKITIELMWLLQEPLVILGDEDAAGLMIN